MGPIANYNLGSVTGEVKITYDGKGVKEAKTDVKGLGDESAGAAGKVDKADGSFKSFRKTASDFGSDVRNTKDAVASFGDTLSALAKPVFLAGAAQSVSALGVAIVPAIGAAAMLPAVLGAAAASMAVVKIGTSGMGDAMTAVAKGDAKALSEAMAKLAPEAREVVQAYAQMKPQLDGLKMSVQNALFNDLNDTMAEMGQTYLPVLTTGLTGVAAQMNEMAFQSAKALMAPETVSAVNAILGDTAGLFQELGPALGNVVSGLLSMGAVGSQYLPAIGTYIGGISQRFQEWAQSAAGQAQINAWIQQGATVLGNLWKILTSIASIVAGVFRPMATDAQGLLPTLVQLTARMDAWVNSAQGQQTIANIWTFLAAISGQLMNVLATLAPIIGAIVSWFGSLPAPVQSVVAGFLAWSVILGLLISKVAPVIGFLVQLPGLIKMVGSAFTALTTGIRVVMTVFRALSVLMMANPWILIIAAVIALVVLIVMNWDTIKTYLAAAWAWIQSTAASVWNGIVGFFTGIWEGIKNTAISVWNGIVEFFKTWGLVVLAVILGPIGILIALLVTYWDQIVAGVTAAFNGIVAFLTVVWEVIFNILRFAAAILLAIFFTIWNPLSELVMTIWNAIVAFLTMIWSGIVAQATALWGMLTAAWQAVWSAVSAVAMAIWNAIVSFLTGVWNGIVSVASAVWNAITSAISAAVSAVSAVIMSIWNAIWGFLQPIWNTISSVASSVWNAISSVISSVMSSISSTITSVWNTIAGFFTSIWATISGAVSNGVNNVMSLLSGLWSKITGLAGSAISLLVDAGRNIVTGLWNGIQSMGAWLYNSIMGWIKSVVPGPVLQFLGIASPSKFMRDEVGKMIPQGIMVGMSAEEGGLIKQAKEMAQATANAAIGGSSVKALIGASAGVSGATTSAGVAAATSNTSNAKTVTIGGLTLQVSGNLDPTNPVLWRDAIAQIKDSIVELERDYV